MSARIDVPHAGTTTHLLGSDWALVRLAQFLNDSRVPPEILLATDQDDGEIRAEVHDLGDPLQEW